jgi:metal-responsive CopG/Arc/MetJ family transcriptional regulator
MAKISISIPDELLTYIDHKVKNRSALIELLLQQWRQQQEDEALAQACNRFTFYLKQQNALTRTVLRLVAG